MGNKEQGGDGRNSTSDEEEEERRRTDGWLQTEASSNLRSKKRPTNRPRPVLYTFAEFPPHLHPSFTSTCASLFLCFFVTAYRTDRTSPPPSLAFFTVCVLRRSGHPPVPDRPRVGMYCILGDGLWVCIVYLPLVLGKVGRLKLMVAFAEFERCGRARRIVTIRLTRFGFDGSMQTRFDLGVKQQVHRSEQPNILKPNEIDSTVGHIHGSLLQ